MESEQDDVTLDTSKQLHWISGNRLIKVNYHSFSKHNQIKQTRIVFAYNNNGGNAKDNILQHLVIRHQRLILIKIEHWLSK